MMLPFFFSPEVILAFKLQSYVNSQQLDERPHAFLVGRGSTPYVWKQEFTGSLIKVLIV